MRNLPYPHGRTSGADRRRLLIGGAVSAASSSSRRARVWIASLLSPFPRLPPAPAACRRGRRPLRRPRAVHPAGSGFRPWLTRMGGATSASTASRAGARGVCRCGDREGGADAAAGSRGTRSPRSATSRAITAPTAARRSGRTAPPPAIFGVALDGVGTALVPDSDGWRHRRRRGPIAPSARCSSSRRPGATGTSTRTATASRTRRTSTMPPWHPRTICAGLSTALNTEAGWRTAIQSYNSSPVYLGRVSTYAVAYVDASAG